MLFMKCDKSDI